MSTSNNLSPRSAMFRTALLTLGCALGLACVQTPTLKAAAPATLQPVADMAPSLPLTATFEKGDAGERGGTFVLKLTNTSQDSLKVSGKILFSVAYHMNTKEKAIPEHAIAAGEVWTISDLAAGDKVTLTAEGFAPLELVVK